MIKAIPYFDNIIYFVQSRMPKSIGLSIHKSNQEKLFDISDKSVALIIKKYTSLSGLDPNKYGGHSLKIRICYIYC